MNESTFQEKFRKSVIKYKQTHTIKEYDTPQNSDHRLR